MRRSKSVGNLATLFVGATVLTIMCSTLSAAEGPSQALQEWQMASQDWQQVSPFLGDVKVPRTDTYQMNIKVYSDPDVDLSSYHTYSIDYTNMDNRLLEKELFQVVGAYFWMKGKDFPQSHPLVKSDENPDVLITMDFYTGKREEYVPPKTVVTTRVENIWSSRMFGWGGYSPVPITESHTTQGYTNVSYY